MRIHHLSLIETSIVLSLGFGPFTAVGVFFSGYLTDKLTVNSQKWLFWLPIVKNVFDFLCIVVVCLSSNVVLVIFFFLTAQTIPFWMTPLTVVSQNVFPARVRSLSFAVLITCFSLFGIIMGPVLVGSVSDILFPIYGEMSVRYGILSGTLFLLIGCLFFYFGSKIIDQEVI